MPGWKAGCCSGNSNMETVGVEIVGRETTVLQNQPKLCCEVVPCKPLFGSDEGKQVGLMLAELEKDSLSWPLLNRWVTRTLQW